VPGSQPRATYDVLRLPDVRRIELGWAAADSLATQRLGVDSPGEAGGPAEPDGSDAGQDPG
jgi:hypothetical protein